jgi:hypothetical protein
MTEQIQTGSKKPTMTNTLMKGTIRNEADLKKVVAEQETAPLDMVVKIINITLGTADTYDDNASSYWKNAQYCRAAAAMMFFTLRRRVEAEGHDWWKWQEGKFDRSRKDIEKLLRIASADHPQAAAEEERTKTRERVQAHRATERTGAAVRSKPEAITITAAPNDRETARQYAEDLKAKRAAAEAPQPKPAQEVNPVDDNVMRLSEAEADLICMLRYDTEPLSLAIVRGTEPLRWVVALGQQRGTGATLDEAWHAVLHEPEDLPEVGRVEERGAAPVEAAP